MKRLLILSAMLPLLSACATISQIAAKLAPPEREEAVGFNEGAQDSLYLGIIDGLIQQGRYEAALAFLDQDKAPSPRADILRGNALLGAGRPKDAVTAFAKAVRSRYAAAAYNGMGRARSAGGDWAAAIQDFRQASAMEPANAEYLNNLGYARLHPGTGDQIVAAVDDLKRAHELAPQSATIRNNLIVATRMSDDRVQVAALLGTITDARKRQAVAEFAARWPLDDAAGDDAAGRANAETSGQGEDE